ncbi:APC family permease [Paraburkholderia tropica]|uniref:APC family permease n=1 Tax=Paraburkholderia tropica TaxID=92647 RepID=UPI002AB7219A|nr:APC family permease [Paraburkholderia tropica]
METKDNFQPSALKKDSLGWLNIVFLVIATNGPLIALAGGAPIVIALGNGIGAVGTYALIGILYLVFSVGFCAMSPHVKNGGAFFAYIARGTNLQLGVGAAFIAIFLYNSTVVGLYAMIGFFISLAIQTHLGLTIPWWLCSILSTGVVYYFGYRNINFSGRVLFALMLLEVGLLVALDAAIALHHPGGQPYSFAPISPSHVFGHGFGQSVVLVVSCFVGFETTAIYSEETRDPERSIPRATFTAITIIAVLYSISVWLVINGVGDSQAVAMAAKDPGSMWFTIAARFLGEPAFDVMSVLMITSILAGLISLHNTGSRYLYVMGREGVLWNKLSVVHKTQLTPWVAGALQVSIAVVLIAISAAVGADPILTVSPLACVPLAIGIVTVQAMTSFAVVSFFNRAPRGTSLWQRTIAPFTSAVALIVCLILMLCNVSTITGTDSMIGRVLAWGTLAVGIVGIAYAYRMRSTRPGVYGRLGKILDET